MKDLNEYYLQKENIKNELKLLEREENEGMETLEKIYLLEKKRNKKQYEQKKKKSNKQWAKKKKTYGKKKMKLKKKYAL